MRAILSLFMAVVVLAIGLQAVAAEYPPIGRLERHFSWSFCSLFGVFALLALGVGLNNPELTSSARH